MSKEDFFLVPVTNSGTVSLIDHFSPVLSQQLRQHSLYLNKMDQLISYRDISPSLRTSVYSKGRASFMVSFIY